MPCPRCGSHRLWDDNLAWGCCDCSFFTTGEIRNVGHTSRDIFHVSDGAGNWVPEKPAPEPPPKEDDES